jgi:hypothetical protein
MPSCFGLAQNVTVSWAEIDRQKGNLNGIKCTSTGVMVFYRVILESR